MEPVTYFTGFGVTVAGYAWWTLTNAEYEYENIYDYLFQKRRNRLYLRSNLDVLKLEALMKQVKNLNQEIQNTDKMLKKSKCIQAQFLDNLSNKIKQ